MPSTKRGRDHSRSSKSASAFDSNDWWSGEKSTQSKLAKSRVKSRSKHSRSRKHYKGEEHAEPTSNSEPVERKEALDFGEPRHLGSVHSKRPRRHAGLQYRRPSHSPSKPRLSKRRNCAREAKSRHEARPHKRSPKESSESTSSSSSESSVSSVYERRKSRSERPQRPYAIVTEEMIDYVRADTSSSSSERPEKPHRRKSYYRRALETDHDSRRQRHRRQSERPRLRSEVLYLPSRQTTVPRYDIPDWQRAATRRSGRFGDRIESSPRGNKQFVRHKHDLGRTNECYKTARPSFKYVPVERAETNTIGAQHRIHKASAHRLCNDSASQD